MSGTIHAFDLLSNPPKKLAAGVCPLFGGQRFLKKLVIKKLIHSLSGGDPEFSSSEFDGNSCPWVDVIDELSTRTLFGGDGPRIVIVDRADNFVSEYRDKLETLLDHPPPDGLLVLVVDSWVGMTKLYKRIDKSGLQVHCDAPIIKRGRGKSRDDAKIIKWLVARAKTEYGFKLPDGCAPVLVELTECNFGLMDQELAKLSLYASDQSEFDPKAVRDIVGGWPAQTMWAAIDAATDGHAGHALNMIDQLFRAGEHPLALFGQIGWALRRFAEVGEIAARNQRNGRRFDMPSALKAAGFRPWGGEMDNAERRLKQLGRRRIGKMLDWIVETDLALKRTHSTNQRGRLMLEQLLVRMAQELGPMAATR